MMIPGFVTIIVIEVSYVWQKKIRSAQNVTDVSFFVVYACMNCNSVKFPLYVLQILKLCLFYLPMLVDYCSHKLFAHKIPMHRKWVRLKCASHMLHDAPIMFQFLSFMWASLSSSCLARKALKKSACWETTQYLSLLFLCVHMIMLL